jgi:hypothetical protein
MTLLCCPADLGPMLQGLLPVLVARMGRLPVEEPAEEVRLSAQQFIQLVVNKADTRCDSVGEAQGVDVKEKIPQLDNAATSLKGRQVDARWLASTVCATRHPRCHRHLATQQTTFYVRCDVPERLAVLAGMLLAPALCLYQQCDLFCACSILSKCSGDLCLLLARGLEDLFPDAKKAAAAGLATLAQRVPQDALEDSAERLVQVCTGLCRQACILHS